MEKKIFQQLVYYKLLNKFLPVQLAGESVIPSSMALAYKLFFCFVLLTRGGNIKACLFISRGLVSTSIKEDIT